MEFDDTINKLNAGLTEGPTLNKYKSSDEDIDARKKKGTLSEETHERLGDLQTVGGVVKETAADRCRVPYAAISLVSDSINWATVIDKVPITKWNTSNSFVADAAEQ